MFTTIEATHPAFDKYYKYVQESGIEHRLKESKPELEKGIFINT